MSNYPYRPPPPGGGGPPMQQQQQYTNAMPPPPGGGGGGGWGGGQQQHQQQQQQPGGPPPPSSGGYPHPPPPQQQQQFRPPPPPGAPYQQQQQQQQGMMTMTGGGPQPQPPPPGGGVGISGPPPQHGRGMPTGPPPPVRGSTPMGGVGVGGPPPPPGRMNMGGSNPPPGGPPTKGPGMMMSGPPPPGSINNHGGPPPPPPPGMMMMGGGRGGPPPPGAGPPPPGPPGQGAFGGAPPPPTAAGGGPFPPSQGGGGGGPSSGYHPQQQPGFAPPPPQPQMHQQGHMPPPMARGGVGGPPLPGQHPPHPSEHMQPPPGGVVPPGTVHNAHAFVEEHIDWNIKHPKEMLQFTTSNIPHSLQLSQTSKVVLGGIIRPFVSTTTTSNNNKNEIPTVMPGPAGIVRCKKCRTYMNAFVTWIDSGRRWRCNICGQPNDCPSAYYCHIDPQTNCRRDKMERPELSQSVVEYIAPNEYMVRPPQPPAYFFVFDVSAQAVGCGMLSHVAKAVKKVLLEDKNLPGSERSQIGFLAYDTAVHYFNLSVRGSSGRSDENGNDAAAVEGCQPQMLTVSDLVELFVPLPPDDLLVNLYDHLDTVETFLEALPTMFSSASSSDGQTPSTLKPSSIRQQESALGPALKAAFTILKPLGGKMLVFNTMLPSIPKIDGYLTPRDATNANVLGTNEEQSLLRPQSNWYKDTAVEFSRAQISVDLFLTNFNYVDVATLTDLPRYTAGNVYSFTNFSSPVHGLRLEHTIYHTLTRPTALEAVMRVRCTRGLRVTNFYGNFYIRGQDLLALPNCSSDATFGFTIQHEDNAIPSNVLTVQSALLYTSTDGERRIRVITTVLPVVKDLKRITNSINVNALSALLAKQGVDYAIKNGPSPARNKLLQGCIDIIKSSRSSNKSTTMTRLPGAPPGAYDNINNANDDDEGIPSHLKLLPLMILSMIKNTALRGGTDVHPDERCIAMQTISTMWSGGSKLKAYLYPKLFRVDQLLECNNNNAGLPCDDINNNDRTTDTDDDLNGTTTGNDHIPNETMAGPIGHKIYLPPMMNLTVNSLTSEGIFCLENGIDAYLWVGRQANPNLIKDLFHGMESIDDIDPSQLTVSYNNSEIGKRLYSILSALQASDNNDGNKEEGSSSIRLFVIRESIDQYMENKFLWHLIEDSSQFGEGGTFTYDTFMQFVHDRSSAVSATTPTGMRGPPGGGPPGSYAPPGAIGGGGGGGGYGGGPPPPGMGGRGPPPPPGGGGRNGMPMNGGPHPPPPGARMGVPMTPQPPSSQQQQHLQQQQQQQPPPPMPPGGGGFGGPRGMGTQAPSPQVGGGIVNNYPPPSGGSNMPMPQPPTNHKTNGAGPGYGGGVGGGANNRFGGGQPPPPQQPSRPPNAGGGAAAGPPPPPPPPGGGGGYNRGSGYPRPPPPPM